MYGKLQQCQPCMQTVYAEYQVCGPVYILCMHPDDMLSLHVLAASDL